MKRLVSHLVMLVLLVAIFAIALTNAVQGGGETCCGDRLILERGVQGAYRHLQAGDVERAKATLERAAEQSGVPL